MPLYPAAIFVRCAIASGLLFSIPIYAFPTPTAFIRIVTPTTSSSPCSSIVRWSDVR